MPENAPSRVFRFGLFELDEAAGELRKQGVPVKLHSQPFQVLIMLLDVPSELVPREEIRRRLWGDGTFVDFDHGLNTAVNKVRQALRDSASEPTYVETVPGKGYRFIAPIEITLVWAASGVASKPPRPYPTVLASAEELPAAPRILILCLLLLLQAMYLAFYLGTLANLPEIREIIEEAHLPLSSLLFAALVASAAAMIPVRLFLCAAVGFDLRELSAKFFRLFPTLLCLDLLWALAPFLLIHHVTIGLSLAMTAALVYTPFAQRSLILMYVRGRRS